MRSLIVTMHRIGLRGCIALSALVLAGASMATPVNWPAKPISMIVSYGAGGSVDYIARLIAPRLAEKLGQEIVVENVGGAAGSIGAARVARSAADGYTILLGSVSEVAIAWAANPNLTYNGITDFSAISLIGTSPMVLVGNKTIPASDLNGLLDYAKQNPGKLSLATSGIATPQHLLLEYINSNAGVDILHVPYRSAASIMADVIGERVDLSILTLTTALAQLETGKLQAFAQTGTRRSSILPNVPVLDENSALKGADISLWFGLLAPKGTPNTIVQRLNQELEVILNEPNIQKNLRTQGLEVVGGTPDSFAKFISDDSHKYQKIISSGNISNN